MGFKLEFGEDEMKNFLLKTGKYKIVSVKCQLADFWSVVEGSVEVAYPIGDTETENWIMNAGIQPKYVFDYLSISGVFSKEIKSKLLNL